MSRLRGLGLGLAVIGVTLAAAGMSAFAADSGVVATAPAGAGAPAPSAAPPANDATRAQIDAWVATTGVASDSAAPQPGTDGPARRTIHGEVSAGVGTGGYRNVSGVADIPVGQASDLIVAVSSASGERRGGRFGGYGLGGDALALGYYANGVPASASGCIRPPFGPPPIQGYASPGPIDCLGAPAP